MTVQDDLPLLLTVADIKRILRIGRGKAYAMIKAREIPSIKLGGSIRIPRDALLRSLEQGISIAEAK
jgi:excisionase family DNA binding protein